MHLREIVLTAVRPLSEQDARIELFSRVICVLVVRAVGKVATRDFKKISLRFSKGGDETDSEKVLGVLLWRKPFTDVFTNLSPVTSPEESVLNYVVSCLGEIAKAESLLLPDIQGIKDFVIGERFTAEHSSKRLSSKGLSNLPDTKVVVVQQTNVADIYLETKREDGRLERLKVAEEKPDEFAFYPYLESARLTEDGHVEIDPGRGRPLLVVDVLNQKCFPA